MNRLLAILTVATALLLPAAALADQIPLTEMGFTVISGKSKFSDQVSISLSVYETDNPNQLRLSFGNTSDTRAIVGQIYMQDIDGLMNSFSWQNAGGISFSDRAKPAYLPGGKSVGFDTTFAFGAKRPSPKWGIGDNESFDMLVDLSPNTVASEFMTGIQSGNIRFGLHVQGLDDGGSLSMASTTVVPAVPEPGTLVLAGTALLGMGWRSWRRRRKVADAA